MQAGIRRRRHLWRVWWTIVLLFAAAVDDRGKCRIDESDPRHDPDRRGVESLAGEGAQEILTSLRPINPLNAHHSPLAQQPLSKPSLNRPGRGERIIEANAYRLVALPDQVDPPRTPALFAMQLKNAR